jgi:hypothetical protein
MFGRQPVLLAAAFLGTALGSVRLQGASPDPGAAPAVEKESGAAQEWREQLRAAAKEWRDAARKDIEWRIKNKLLEADEGTDFLEPRDSAFLLRAEVAVAKSPEERLAAYQAYLDNLKLVEPVHQKRAEAKKLSRQGYLETQAALLQARIWLLQEQRKVSGKPPAEKETIQNLRTKRLEVAREVMNEETKEFFAGRNTLDRLWERSSWVLEAETEAGVRPADRIEALRMHLQAAQGREDLDIARFRAGRVPILDYTTTTAARLQAEVSLLQAEAPEDKKHEIRELHEQRHQAMQTVRQVMTEEFKAGRGSLEYFLDLWPQVLEAELAVATSPAQEVKAYQSHRDNLRTWEDLCEKRADQKRVSRAAYLRVKVTRLQAEVGLATAKSKVPSPAE